MNKLRYLTFKNRRKDNWTGHILSTNCFLKQAIKRRIEGRLEVTGS